MVFEVILWASVFLIFYIYVGYLLVLVLCSKLLGNKERPLLLEDAKLPGITLFIAAWNEKDFVHEKMKNTLDLDYPAEKLVVLWVTDGSDDGTPDLLREYPGVKVLHEARRCGKIGAMNRGMKHVETPIVVFCDANTYLSKESLRHMATEFTNPAVGCVAGEKRIFENDKDKASGSGEGLYWKIEAKVKKLESELGSTVGAAGELFAIRTELFQEVQADSILDDFQISMGIASKGFMVKYCPEASAYETSSDTVADEMKRKIRIAAGGFQVIPRLKSILNPFKHPWLAFTFISHKVLRWVALPVLFLLCLVANTVIVSRNFSWFYLLILVAQVLFYLLSVAGYLLRNKQLKSKIVFAPYYLNVMNLSIVLGFLRYMKKSQNVNWDRAKRTSI